jgi:hypothetical protein
MRAAAAFVFEGKVRYVHSIVYLLQTWRVIEAGGRAYVPAVKILLLFQQALAR